MACDMSRFRSLVVRSLFIVALSGLVLIGVQFYRKSSTSPIEGYRRITFDVNSFPVDDATRLPQRNARANEKQTFAPFHSKSPSAGLSDRLLVPSESIAQINSMNPGRETSAFDTKTSVQLAHDGLPQSLPHPQSSVPVPEDSSQLWRRFNEGRNRSSSNESLPSNGGLQNSDLAKVVSPNIEVRPPPAEAAAAAASGETSSSSSRVTQKPGYIPHRCPPAFDKISDTQYEWFLKNVAQRSPASGHSMSTFSDEILILTPISNSVKHLQRYFENICSLVYPHRLISIVLGEDSSTDKTVEMAQQMVDELGSYFRRVELVRLPQSTRSFSGQNQRHDPSWQFIRRRHLAMVRNQLLIRGLGLAGPGVRWVLWIDSDIRHIPRDLVRHLVAANQSVVVPNCLWKQDDGQTATYDRNTWQETDLSRAEQHAMAPDVLMLEGYAPSKRRYLNDVKNDGDIVPVDGVGGCVLLVDAELHRSGLVFPPYVFDHHIETEGFAKAVAKFGVRMFGLPSVNVIHW